MLNVGMLLAAVGVSLAVTLIFGCIAFCFFCRKGSKRQYRHQPEQDEEAPPPADAKLQKATPVENIALSAAPGAVEEQDVPKVQQACEEVDDEIEALQQAIRDSVVEPRTLLLASTFLAAISAGGRRRNAELAAKRALLLSIAAKLLRVAGRRKGAAEAESIDEDNQPPVEELPKQVVSFKNYVIPDPVLASPPPIIEPESIVETLRTALNRDPVDAEELSLAIEKARRADVDPMLMQRAEQCFMNLIDRNSTITLLASALQSRLLKNLRPALQKASTVGLLPTDHPDSKGVGLVQKAQMVVDEEEKNVVAELESALKAGGALRIQRAIAQAKEAAVEHAEEGLMRKAELKLQAIGNKKKCIAILKVALAAGNVGLLRSAVAECEGLGLQDGEVSFDLAKKRLASLEHAAANLKLGAQRVHDREKVQVAGASQTSIHKPSPQEMAEEALKAVVYAEEPNINMLRLVLKQAADVGLDGPDVHKGRSLLTWEENRQEALQQVRQAGAERSTAELAAAIKRCNQLGIPPIQLLHALQQLTEDMAKVALIAGDHGISNLMLEDVEQARVELHDQIQAVRGGARVLCRIRPTPAGEDRSRQCAVEVADRNTLKVGSSGAATASFHRFNGAVFGPETSQEIVFEEVKGLVQSAVDGFNVLVCAAGAARSGKSYTIFGPQSGGRGAPRQRDWTGLASRAMQELFAIEEQDRWRAALEVEMQLVEVRGQRVVDLLGRGTSAAKPTSGLSFAGNLLIAPRSGGLPGVEADSRVEGATSKRVSSCKEFLDLLEPALLASDELHSGGSKGEAPPSEHHMLAFLHLTRTNRATGVPARSKLVLGDLGGITASAAADVRGLNAPPLEQGAQEVGAAYQSIQAIVKGARKSGQVRASLLSSQGHIVGQLLQDCLIGRARPVFIVTLSPDPSEAETVKTMRAVKFASALGGRPIANEAQ